MTESVSLYIEYFDEWLEEADSVGISGELLETVGHGKYKGRRFDDLSDKSIRGMSWWLYENPPKRANWYMISVFKTLRHRLSGGLIGPPVVYGPNPLDIDEEFRQVIRTTVGVSHGLPETTEPDASELDPLPPSLHRLHCCLWALADDDRILTMSDRQIAALMGLAKSTITNYRTKLIRLGYVSVVSNVPGKSPPTYRIVPVSINSTESVDAEEVLC